MFSERLRYQPVNPASLDAFHSLVQDEHVRQYMMDSNIFPREWSEERIQESQALFEQRGVGLWLVHEKTTDALVGFCGFLEIISLHNQPELVYALFKRFSGNGYATEMARTAISYAREKAGFTEIVAGVDEVNSASLRVLEKLGFERTTTQQGSFGNLFSFRLSS